MKLNLKSNEIAVTSNRIESCSEMDYQIEGNQMWKLQWNRMWNRMWNQMWNQMWNLMWNWMWNQMWNRV